MAGCSPRRTSCDLQASPPQFAQRVRAKAALAATLSGHSQARRSRSLWLQAFLQVHQSVSISGRCRILRNAERSGDLVKRKFVPDFQDEHLALILWQTADCRSERGLRLAFPFKLRLDGWIGVGEDSSLTPGAAFVARDKIESDRAHSGVKERAIVNFVVSPPKLDESFLHNVFGISCRSRP